MYSFDTSPEFRKKAQEIHYHAEDLETLRGGLHRYPNQSPFVQLPNEAIDLIRQYNTDDMGSKIRQYGSDRGMIVGAVALGPDLVWAKNTCYRTASNSIRALLAIPPPRQQREDATANQSLSTEQQPRVVVKRLTGNENPETAPDVEWCSGRVYILNDNEVIHVAGGIGFVGIQYACSVVGGI